MNVILGLTGLSAVCTRHCQLIAGNIPVALLLPLLLLLPSHFILHRTRFHHVLGSAASYFCGSQSRGWDGFGRFH